MPLCITQHIRNAAAGKTQPGLFSFEICGSILMLVSVGRVTKKKKKKKIARMLWCSRTCKESVLRAPCIKYSIRSCSSCHTAAKNSQTNSSSVTWCGQHLGDTKSHMGNENYNFPSQCRAGALSECTLGSFQYLFHLMVELACIMVLLSVWVPCYPVSVSFFSVFPSITVFLFCSLLFFSIEESQFPSSATKGTPGIWLLGGGQWGICKSCGGYDYFFVLLKVFMAVC